MILRCRWLINVNHVARFVIAHPDEQVHVRVLCEPILQVDDGVVLAGSCRGIAGNVIDIIVLDIVQVSSLEANGVGDVEALCQERDRGRLIVEGEQMESLGKTHVKAERTLTGDAIALAALGASAATA